MTEAELEKGPAGRPGRWIDVFSSEHHPSHHALLARGMTWIEGLWLADAEPGLYELIALPILLEGADGAPVRAILRRSFEF